MDLSKESTDIKLIDEPIDWRRTFTDIKHIGNLSIILPFTAPELTLKIENAIMQILKSEPIELQKKISETSLVYSGVNPEDMSKEDYTTLKKEIEMEFKSGQEQYNHALQYKKTNTEKYVYWLKKSAEKGFCKAQIHLGCCYYNGEGVIKNEKKAFELYKVAEKENNEYAQHNLGVCYKNGIGVSRDEKKAAEWYIKAANQGHTPSQYSLGICYECGNGVSRDISKAVEWYTKAANQGHAEAQHNLGCCYRDLKDLKKAVEWYTKAANQGHSPAQYNLGCCYLYGEGVSRDEKKAIEIFTKLSEKNYCYSSASLSVCYKNGIGVIKDEDKAKEYFDKAISEGIKQGKNIENLKEAMNKQ